MFSTNAVLTFALGLLLGGGILPAIAIAQALTSLALPRGGWLYMLLTMALWFLMMFLYLQTLELGFQNALPFPVRRANVLLIVVGLFAGMFTGGIAVRRLRAGSQSHE
jgi:hypothetical protein